jgi:hypothetical protein
LLLKINNKGEDVKVSYDLKAVTQEINRSLNAEKEVLKTIISEEYGDKPENQEPTEKSAQKKERFRITWEETDSVPVSEKREEEKGFRDLFRKN